MNAGIVLSSDIPLLLDDPERLSRFVEKAAKGSCKANEWLVESCAELANRASGRNMYEDAPIEELHAFLAGLIPAEPPCTAQDLADAVADAAWMGQRISMTTQARHDDSFYDDMWKRGARAERTRLVHDATLYCYENWKQAAFAELLETTSESMVDYNSRKAVSALIFLMVARAKSGFD